jgi:hypothetical protein
MNHRYQLIYPRQVLAGKLRQKVFVHHMVRSPILLAEMDQMFLQKPVAAAALFLIVQQELVLSNSHNADLALPH